MKFDVIGLGALNYDRLHRVRRLAKPGEHEPIEGLWESPGGSAANTIACLARLGFKTGFIGAVGKDHEGEVVLKDFEKHNVDVKKIRILNGRTGIVMVLVDENGERTLYPYPGVNDNLMLDKSDLKYAADSRFLHMSSFIGDRQFKSQRRLAGGLPDHVKLSFAPGDIYVNKGYGRIKPLLDRTNILFLNEVEIKSLTGLDYNKGSLKLIEEGIDIVAVTLGERGCYVRDINDGRQIKTTKTRVLDTTGAGDAFAAGFLAGLLKNSEIQECCTIGNKTALQCIRQYGARPHLKKITTKKSR